QDINYDQDIHINIGIAREPVGQASQQDKISGQKPLTLLDGYGNTIGDERTDPR
ncbi:hypothetical protein BGX27_005301, partial [Mortierella sp. AM989]